MTSNFPGSADNIANNVTNSTAELDTHPTLHNKLADAVNAVEAALLPGGTMNLAAHVAAADPHAVYLTQTEGDARYATIGGATVPDGSITSAKIADGTIVAGDIADGAITSAKILDGTIDTADLKDGSVTSAKIADGTIVAADIANATVTNAKLASDTARANLLTNGGFEVWQRGNGPFTASGAYFADRWSLGPGAGSTFSVTLDSVNTDASAAAAAVVYTHAAASSVTQKLESAPFRGRTITLSVRVRTTVASAVRLRLDNDSSGVGTAGAYHTGGGTYQTLSVTASIPAAATAVYAVVMFDAACTAYLDNAMLVVGSQYADYAPLHPADDLARCQRYYQRWTPSTTSFAIAPAHATSTTNAFIYVPLLAPMAVVPTLTISSLAHWGLANAAYNSVLPATALTLATVVNNLAVLNGTVASGLTLGQWSGLWPNSGSAWLALEANP